MVIKTSLFIPSSRMGGDEYAVAHSSSGGLRLHSILDWILESGQDPAQQSPVCSSVRQFCTCQWQPRHGDSSRLLRSDCSVDIVVVADFDIRNSYSARTDGHVGGLFAVPSYIR